jgi:hypothetical protein
LKKLDLLWFSLFMVGALGCGFLAGGVAATEEIAVNTSDGSTETPPARFEAPMAVDGNVIDMPSENEAAPDGILQQLSWGGKGGPGDPQPCGDCTTHIDQSTISLEKFKPHQRLEVFVYRFSNSSQCSMYVSDYVTMLLIQVDDTGSFSAPLGGSTEHLYVAKIIDQDTGENVMSINYGHAECPTYIPD